MANNDSLKKWVNNILEPTGIELDGPNPWDIKILNQRFYNRVKSQGSLGLGESYMDGDWECQKLDEFFFRLLSTDIYSRIGISLPIIIDIIKARIFNLQAINRAFEVGKKHYDLGNDLFIPMLGKTMAYSCGYWREASDLDSAEEAKFDLICRKLNLQRGQKVLDIGCGWGGFAKYAAENYGVSVVGVTISKEQAEFATETCKGLPVNFRLIDYRNLNEKFDHIISVGMFEHVGTKNYKNFMKVAKRCLNENGLFLLHTIGKNESKNTPEPWIGKYIFPNGILPSLKQITESAENLFIVEDVHNFGTDYDKTLMAWHENFKKSWPLLEKKYGDRFYRMWNYYLLSCAGAFRARSIQLWQVVLSPHGVSGGYKSIR